MANNSIQTIYLDATTKKYTIPTGYHSSGGSVQVRTTTGSATPTTSNKTYTPTSGYLYSGFTVYGDSDLKSENIKSGVSIFGVEGSYCTPKDYLLETNDGTKVYMTYMEPDGIGEENGRKYLTSNIDFESGSIIQMIPGTLCAIEADSDDGLAALSTRMM